MLKIDPTRRRVILVLFSVCTGVFLGLRYRWSVWSLYTRLRGRKTVAERLSELGPVSRERLSKIFEASGVQYPPRELLLVGLKAERELRVYARQDGAWQQILSFPVLAASGGEGPKLRNGDRQVPEGMYQVQSLNPNSRFHLSLRLNYPNRFDLARAKAEGRSDLGGDIMIHGGDVSVGCLAIGDNAIEDLFVLVADVGIQDVQIIISPHDMNARPVPEATRRSWNGELYGAIRDELEKLPN